MVLPYGDGPAAAAGAMGTTMQNPVPTAPPGQLGHSAQTVGPNGQRVQTGLNVAPRPQTSGNNGMPLDFGGSYNQKNPQAVIRDFMRQHGLDPTRHSGFGDFVHSLMTKIVPTLFQNMYAGGLNEDGTPKMALDQLGDPMALLNSIFASGTGNLGANLKGFATDAATKVRNDPGLMNLPQEVTARMFTDLNGLESYGLNPYESLASQDAPPRLQRARRAERQAGQEGEDHQDREGGLHRPPPADARAADAPSAPTAGRVQRRVGGGEGAKNAGAG